MCLLSEKLSVKFLPPSDIFYSIFFVITVLQQTQDHPRTFDKSLMAFYKIKKKQVITVLSCQVPWIQNLHLQLV